MAGDTHATRVLAIAAERGQVRSSDLTEAGIPRAELARLVRRGRLKQVARGLYALPAQPFSALHPLAEVAARSSRGVFCLLTALHFHRLLRPRRARSGSPSPTRHGHRPPASLRCGACVFRVPH
jgi:predicted transcriptional regulator of viral defense system